MTTTSDDVDELTTQAYIALREGKQAWRDEQSAAAMVEQWEAKRDAARRLRLEAIERYHLCIREIQEAGEMNATYTNS